MARVVQRSRLRGGRRELHGAPRAPLRAPRPLRSRTHSVSRRRSGDCDSTGIEQAEAHPAELDHFSVPAQRGRSSTAISTRPSCWPESAARKRTPAVEAQAAAALSLADGNAEHLSPARRDRRRFGDCHRDADQASRTRRGRSCPVHSGPPQRHVPFGRDRSSETIAPRMSAGCRWVPEMSGRSISPHDADAQPLHARPGAIEILEIEDRHVAAVAAWRSR